MVLFNNPVVKQQILTMFRQMYPENPQQMLRHFKEVTFKAYGYLLIDLKPTTPEHLRMRTNIMNTIKPKSTERLSHFWESRPNVQTCKEGVKQLKEKSKPSRTTTAQLHCTQIESEEMPSWLVLENMHDLQKRAKNGVLKDVSPKRKRDDEEMKKWNRTNYLKN